MPQDSQASAAKIMARATVCAALIGALASIGVILLAARPVVRKAIQAQLRIDPVFVNTHPEGTVFARDVALRKEITTHGGLLYLSVSGSGAWHNNENQTIGVSVELDGEKKFEATSFSQRPATHFPFNSAFVLVPDISDGKHTLTLTLINDTRVDENDSFNVTIIEIPKVSP